MSAAAKRVLSVWLGLCALLALTTAIAFVPLGSLNYGIAIGIAVAKALLVLLFFMELVRGTSLVRAFAAAGFFWLLIMIILTWADLGYRHDVNVPLETSPPTQGA